MGIGPVEAVPKLLKRTGITLNDINLIELNEAFACQSLAVIQELKLAEKNVNVNGGAIALGHPLGCTGAKTNNFLNSRIKETGGRTRLGHHVCRRRNGRSWPFRSQLKKGGWLHWQFRFFSQYHLVMCGLNT